MTDSQHQDMERLGPFDGIELMRWAETYGHPEEWAKRAQAAHSRAEDLASSLATLKAQADRYREALERVCGEVEAYDRLENGPLNGGPALAPDWPSLLLTVKAARKALTQAVEEEDG